MSQQIVGSIRKTETQDLCKVCGDTGLDRLADYSSLPRVTSDCKPWPAGGELSVCGRCGAIQKIANQSWFEEISAIYKGYEIYHLSDGSEQVIFNGKNGANVPRSHRLVDFLVETLKLPQSGRLLDMGCGNGSALTNFSRALPGWTLYGSEISDAALQLLRRLPNFDTLFTCKEMDIPGSYNLISMIHSLEHMPDPLVSLRNARERLGDGGWLFIEVPDASTSPFDVLVADHLVHLTRETLKILVRRAGLIERVLTNKILPKELTFVGGRGEEKQGFSRTDSGTGKTLASEHLRWLSEIINNAQRIAANGNSFGIFGTSISGMWLYGALREKVDFFVDEDRSRVGRQYQGRTIYLPEDVPAGADVFVPLVPDVAASVAQRCAHLPACFHLPPSYPKSRALHTN